MRIEIRFNDDEPAARAVLALPPRERALALRLLVRRHYVELVGLVGLTGPAPAVSPAPPVEGPSGTPDVPAAPMDEGVGTEKPPRAERADVKKMIAKAKAMQQRAVVAAALSLASLGLFAPHSASAQEPRLTLDVNVASWHTEQWARHGLNQNNPGVGLTFAFDSTWAVSAGTYFNSYRRWTTYGLAQFTPFRLDNSRGWVFKAGVAGGIASGYHKSEVPTAPLIGAGLLKVITPHGFSANVYVVPNTGARASGFIGVQFRFPLPSCIAGKSCRM